MSEYPNEEEQLTDPKPSGQSTADDNYRGDAGDQGNDIRFAEEEQLIREQASPKSVNRDDEGEYTDAEGAEGGKSGKDEGGYTDAEGTQDS
ncbi:hypothetical protein QNO08_00375 [Arthrobacter sp. zg-Y820]|uniref:hypothetical protein n=1 Tax=unclassified Arthrobacter TaxID=235627 RepID=UPI001E377B48|nr:MULTISPECIES: hypothetical protein [unclassified Arthrobacter]MCC9197439.1 hypothetical protein [Arthrobacter sp. zg-Y820]MDK1280306.1 hypothetical protein [Arthrobacter sp. zg.Y820]MDK1360557.1 hypothetical protein [Arthrobacter sp. zg-Y1219]WIB09593.1 hypothetical protein QNO08_00375 [Arthrobacter sp. zg-Y820]